MNPSRELSKSTISTLTIFFNDTIWSNEYQEQTGKSVQQTSKP